MAEQTRYVPRQGVVVPDDAYNPDAIGLVAVEPAVRLAIVYLGDRAVAGGLAKDLRNALEALLLGYTWGRIALGTSAATYSYSTDTGESAGNTLVRTLSAYEGLLGSPSLHAALAEWAGKASANGQEDEDKLGDLAWFGLNISVAEYDLFVRD